ncbi:MAG: MBL fold metallo-hydrolase [Candidatus Brocadiia bacterium]
MKITYFGHAFFLVEGEDGPAIAIDPFDDSLGYQVPQVKADLVLASHEHFDHANLQAIQGQPKHLVGRAGEGDHEVCGVAIRGVPTKHFREAADSARGDNTVFVIALDGIRLCHLGDLGHALSKETVEQLGRVDILMVPIGGFYTLDVQRVDQVVESVDPRVVIPMHYRTPAATSPAVRKIEPAAVYLGGKDNVREKQAAVRVMPDDLPQEREIWKMRYAEWPVFGG